MNYNIDVLELEVKAMDNKNIYLFPTMLDEYQQQLTLFLEQERYDEAKGLLRFLLSCTGDERQHAIEWGHLLNWLEQSFPSNETEFVEEDDKQLEAEFRRAALSDYGSTQNVESSEKLMHSLQEETDAERLFLALERAVYITEPKLNEQIIEWLEQTELHPVVQFRTLCTLKKRGATGVVGVKRFNEQIQFKIEDTPLQMNEFPKNVNDVLYKVINIVEDEDVTLLDFSISLWQELLPLLYGTHQYRQLVDGPTDLVNCFAASLHHTLIVMVYSEVREEEIRDIYGITDELRFRYEQISRLIRDLAIIIQEGL